MSWSTDWAAKPPLAITNRNEARSVYIEAEQKKVADQLEAEWTTAKDAATELEGKLKLAKEKAAECEAKLPEAKKTATELEVKRDREKGIFEGEEKRLQSVLKNCKDYIEGFDPKDYGLDQEVNDVTSADPSAAVEAEDEMNGENAGTAPAATFNDIVKEHGKGKEALDKLGFVLDRTFVLIKCEVPSKEVAFSCINNSQYNARLLLGPTGKKYYIDAGKTEELKLTRKHLIDLLRAHGHVKMKTSLNREDFKLNLEIKEFDDLVPFELKRVGGNESNTFYRLIMQPPFPVQISCAKYTTSFFHLNFEGNMVKSKPGHVKKYQAGEMMANFATKKGSTVNRLATITTSQPDFAHYLTVADIGKKNEPSGGGLQQQADHDGNEAEEERGEESEEENTEG